MSYSPAAQQEDGSSSSSNAGQKMTTTTTTPAVLDSLPYIDPVNEDYEQYALALIEAEMQQTAAAAPSQSSSQQPIQTTARSQIFEETVQRLQKQQQHNQQGDDNTPRTPLLPNRSFPTAPSNDSSDDVQAWREAVRAAKIACESERLRALQLEVAREESAALWNRYNSAVAEPRWEAARAQLAARRRAVDEVNRARQAEQTETHGRQLRVLSTQYEELIRKQRQLKEAVADLEAQVEGPDAISTTTTTTTTTGQKRKSSAS